MWQNGMYKHNEGERRKDGTFHWNDQPFLTFAGFHDDESHYQKTFLHVYDWFRAPYARVKRFNDRNTINRTTYGGQPIMTTYFKSQKPIISGVQAVLTSPDQLEGEYDQAGTVTLNTDILPTSRTFQGYMTRRRRYIYDEVQEACVLEVDENGEESKDGRLVYNFTLSGSGTYRLIALVSFPFYGNDRIEVKINGQSVTIGGNNLEEWYPFYVDGHHYYDVGSFSFGTSNTIEVGLTNGAIIYGFIVCQSFDQNFIGGSALYDTNIQPFYKRGEVVDGKTTKVKADVPSNLALTTEIIRREPRPAIIWEDRFAHYITGGYPSQGLTYTNYYQRARTGVFYPGSGQQVHEENGTFYCIDGYYNVGMSSGTWHVEYDENDVANAYADTRGGKAQLVLNKQFSTDAQAEVDMRAEHSGAYGIRFGAQSPGYDNDGYLFLLDFRDKKVKLYFESNGSKELVTESDMSTTLATMLGERTTLRLTRLGSNVRGYVGDREYFNITWPYNRSTGAWGIYAEDCLVRCYRFTLSTLERWEPMEKIQAIVDGQEYNFGEVERTVGYDKYGYLVYRGLDIKDTEVDPEEWDLDFRNIPIAHVPGWEGKKTVEIKMIDAGIWLRSFYVVDSEGGSVAWNGDYKAFIQTTNIIKDYNVKGIAMWTLGQEDPRVFTYLPDAR